MAPMFVWIEVLFMLDYKPEMQERLKKLVDADIAQYRASLKKIK